MESDSDDDDELMNALAAGVMKPSIGSMNECAQCQSLGATLLCPLCQSVYYCDVACQRRHFQSHRRFCIRVMESHNEENDEESAEEEEDDDDEEDDEDEKEENQIPTEQQMKMKKGKSSSNDWSGISALSEQELKKLLNLASQITDVKQHDKAINDLNRKITELAKNNDANHRLSQENGSATTPKAIVSAHSHIEEVAESVKQKDFLELQKELRALEKKTMTNINPYAASNNNMGAMAGQNSLSPPTYVPLLVKNDEALKKFFKLKEMNMPEEQIKMKMEREGFDPKLLDTPDAVSPNDKGPPPGAYIPLRAGDDPKLKKYYKLKEMNMAIDQIKMKMEVDGVDPCLLDDPDKISPNDLGATGISNSPNKPVLNFSGLPGMPQQPLSSGVIPPASPYVPMLVKDDPKYTKYFKLRSLGMPEEQIKLKMKADGVDSDLLDHPDDVSPNDTGAPVASASPASFSPGGTLPNGMTIEQLFVMVMQHQQMISQGGIKMGTTTGGDTRTPAKPVAVKDQMAAEMAAAESAVDDIFGDEETIVSTGMTMVQQLEKKARRDANKLMVDNKSTILKDIDKILKIKLKTVEEAIEFYNVIHAELEKFGLTLGTDAVQTWSKRMLIRNKDTKDWHFSEEERLNAGNAYNRLWSLSTLTLNVEQLNDKYNQVVNAPSIISMNVKNKAELIDKYTQLLKECVKTKHKILKSGTYSEEIKRMKEQNIPQDIEERCNKMMGASVILGKSVIDIAKNEYNVMQKTTRGPMKLLANNVIHICEKAVQFIGIIHKLQVENVPSADEIKKILDELKSKYQTNKTEEEDDDDAV